MIKRYFRKLAKAIYETASIPAACKFDRQAEKFIRLHLITREQLEKIEAEIIISL